MRAASSRFPPPRRVGHDERNGATRDSPARPRAPRRSGPATRARRTSSPLSRIDRSSLSFEHNCAQSGAPVSRAYLCVQNDASSHAITTLQPDSDWQSTALQLIFSMIARRMNWSDRLLQRLKENEVRLVTYVPDNVLTPLIRGAAADNYFIAVRGYPGGRGGRHPGRRLYGAACAGQQ